MKCVQNVQAAFGPPAMSIMMDAYLQPDSRIISLPRMKSDDIAWFFGETQPQGLNPGLLSCRPGLTPSFFSPSTNSESVMKPDAFWGGGGI